jgi:uncharacterized protein
MKRALRIVLFLNCIWVVALTCAWATMPAKPQGWVSDFDGILSDQTKAQITSVLDETEKSTGDEIAVVTIPSLEGMTVEDYAVKLFEKWGIGKKGKDNGVLFLVAANEHKVRIEVGYGLEPVITDSRAGDIIRETVLPFFKAGDYDEGILQGSAHITALITGKDFIPSTPLPGPEPQRASEPWTVKVGVMLFFALFLTIGFLILGAALRQKGQGFLRIWGAGFGGIPLFMSLAFAAAMGFPIYILPVWAACTFVIGIISGKKILHSAFASGTSSSGRGRGFFSGGSSSGSSFGGFSGGSSFGGFSGGSSGGGGASGSW